MTTYTSSGHAYLVCPALLELDRRHARHWAKHPACALGHPCPPWHEHEEALADAQGHRVVDFHWWPGCDHISEHYDCEQGCHDSLRCGCGERLVPADLDDPYEGEHGA